MAQSKDQALQQRLNKTAKRFITEVHAITSISFAVTSLEIVA
jgi:hypothetical protein